MKQSKKTYNKYEPNIRQRDGQPKRREIGHYEMLRYYTSNIDSDKRRTISEYRSILKRYAEFLINKILNGHQVALPCGTGYLSIRGRKQTIETLPPDWKKTNELWNNNPEAKKKKQIVYCLNHHTDGIVYKIYWSKRNVYVFNKQYYTFLPCRKFKRFVRDCINNGNQYYVRNN